MATNPAPCPFNALDDPSEPPLWAIVVDCQLTRRKRYHAVQRPDGEFVFKSRLFWDCVEFLDAEAVTRYEIVAGALSGREEVRQIKATKGT